MSDLFLGVIAVAVAIMAIVQLGAIAFALKAARRVDDAVARLERDVKPILADLQPIVTNLQEMSTNVARASHVAATQAERASDVLAGLAKRLDDTAAVVQSSIVGPAREGYAIFHGIVAALNALRQPPPPPRKRPTTTDDEDALFIG